jgi:phage tail-like protein
MSKKSDSRADPFVNFAFRVEIDGIELFGFQEVSGLSNQTDIYEYQEGGENQYTHKLVGQTTFSNLLLKYGITTDSKALYDWRKQVIDGDIETAKKGGTISLFNKKGEYKKSWTFYNAWPCKLDVEAFSSMGNGIAVSTLELALESVEEN